MEKDLVIPTEAKKIIQEIVANPTMQLKYLKIVHFIFEYERLYPEIYKATGKQLHQDTLEKILGLDNTSPLLKSLEAWAIIRRTLGYNPGIKSFSYVLHPKLNTSKTTYISHPVAKQRLLAESIKHGRVSEDQLSKKTYKILSEHTTISKAGLKYLEQKYPSLAPAIEAYELCQPIPRFEIENMDAKDIIFLNFLTGKHFSKRPDTENRLHSSFTCLATEHKKYILLDDKPLMAVDISNCSLSLSVRMIEDHLRMKSGVSEAKFIVPEEMVQYRTLCEIDKIYDEIAKEANDDLIVYDRSEFKQKFFTQQFFGEKAWGALAFAFKRMFPTLIEAIREIKEKYGYKKFSVNLQKMESQVMLDKVFRQLTGGAKNYKVLTVHDCIYTNDEQIRTEAELLIKAEFKKKYNLNISTKNSDVEEIQTAIPKIQILPQWFEPYRSKVTIFDKKMVQYKNVYIYLTELTILFEDYPHKVFTITREQIHEMFLMKRPSMLLYQLVPDYFDPTTISPLAKRKILDIFEQVQLDCERA